MAYRNMLQKHTIRNNKEFYKEKRIHKQKKKNISRNRWKW